MPWLKLIRWQNLLIISLTQLLVWWCVVLPQQPRVLTAAHFCLLTLSTVLIAAAGYIINDYFDIKIDQVNHPEKMVLGKSIPRKTAIIAHTVINVIGIALAGYVAHKARHYEWLLLQLGCASLLWFYSTTYKRRYMVGNITVALLTSLAVMALLIYEPVIQRSVSLPFLHSGNPNRPSPLPFWILCYYAYFAFMLTWMREIVKDMEDLEGDDAEGCVTMPITRGLRYATSFTSVIGVLAILPLLSSAIVLHRHGYTVMAFYVIVLLAIPLALWIWFLWHGPASPAHYHKASRLLKIIMVLGICSLLIYKYQ